MSLAPNRRRSRAIQAEIEAFLFDGVPGAASSAFTRNEAGMRSTGVSDCYPNVTRSRHSDLFKGQAFRF